jgi:hypothetical protein
VAAQLAASQEGLSSISESVSESRTISSSVECVHSYGNCGQYDTCCISVCVLTICQCLIVLWLLVFVDLTMKHIFLI